MLLTSISAGALAGLASIPHCAGMCGPLAAAGCAAGKKASAVYQVARLAAYGSLGGLVGMAGGSIARVLPASGTSVVLGAVMAAGLLFAAARLLRARPTPALVKLRIPGAGPRPAAQSLLLPAGLGLGTALLPCGSLYGALLLAAASGRAAEGAMTLVAFGFVSAVGLVGAQSLAGWLESKGGMEGRRVVAFVLALGAVLAVLRPVASLATGGAACH